MHSAETCDALRTRYGNLRCFRLTAKFRLQHTMRDETDLPIAEDKMHLYESEQYGTEIQIDSRLFAGALSEANGYVEEIVHCPYNAEN